MNSSDFLFNDLLIPRSYSALPEFMKPNVEPLPNLNPNPDKEDLVPVGPFIVAPEALAKFGSEKDDPDFQTFPFYGN